MHRIHERQLLVIYRVRRAVTTTFVWNCHGGSSDDDADHHLAPVIIRCHPHLRRALCPSGLAERHRRHFARERRAELDAQGRLRRSQPSRRACNGQFCRSAACRFGTEARRCVEGSSSGRGYRYGGVSVDVKRHRAARARRVLRRALRCASTTIINVHSTTRRGFCGAITQHRGSPFFWPTRLRERNAVAAVSEPHALGVPARVVVCAVSAPSPVATTSRTAPSSRH